MRLSTLKFISCRQLLGKDLQLFQRILYYFSIFSVSLGTCALILVLAVLNDFTRNLEESYLAYIPHAILSSKKGYISDKINPNFLNEQVKYLAPVVEADVIIQGSGISTGTILGIDPNKKDPLLEKSSTDMPLTPGKYRVILGVGLMANLKLHIGDKVRILVPESQRLIGALGMMPSSRVMTVAGYFHAENGADYQYALLHIDDAVKLMGYPKGNITGLRIFLDHPFEEVNKIQQSLPENYIWKTWQQKESQLYQAVKVEYNSIISILVIIIITSVCSLIAVFSLLVVQKRKDIAILQLLGLSRTDIVCLFSFNAFILSCIGTCLGVVVAYLLSPILPHILSYFFIPGDVISLRFLIRPIEAIIVAFSIVLVCIIGSLYPAISASKFSSHQILRHE